MNEDRLLTEEEYWEILYKAVDTVLISDLRRMRLQAQDAKTLRAVLGALREISMESGDLIEFERRILALTDELEANLALKNK